MIYITKVDKKKLPTYFGERCYVICESETNDIYQILLSLSQSIHIIQEYEGRHIAGYTLHSPYNRTAAVIYRSFVDMTDETARTVVEASLLCVTEVAARTVIEASLLYAPQIISRAVVES